MWDATHVDLQLNISSVDAQRNIYSACYGGNMCKGSVFFQVCGWVGVEHLYVESTIDSHYQEHSGIF